MISNVIDLLDKFSFREITFLGGIAILFLCKILDRIGYVLSNVFRNLFLSVLISFAVTVTCTSQEPYNKSVYLVNFIGYWILFGIFILLLLSINQLFIEFKCPKFVFKYVSRSVQNNIIDDCIWRACTKGQLIEIVTKFKKQYIVFPKYSSSYDCKIINKKYLRVFMLKKGNINKDKSVECYEDNTQTIINRLKALEQKNRSFNILFEAHDCVQVPWYKRLSNIPYPKVPFYQVLSEFEERINFNDIVSITICHVQEFKSEDKNNGMNFGNNV